MKKDILFILHYTQTPGEKGNGRFHYLAEKVDKKIADVEVVTTSFSHSKKKQKELPNEYTENSNYEFTMLYEPGYNKNVSIKRLFSHYVLGRNLKKYLKKRKKPDLIYCSIPSLDMAKIAAKYASDNKVHLILDIQDLWPEAFQMVFNIPVLSQLIYKPIKKTADNIYQSADNLIAVSETYLNRALEVSTKVKEGMVVFLGTDLNDFDCIFSENAFKRNNNDEIWIAYIGTLGHSYDLATVFDALEILKNKGIDNLKFIIMGDGPLKRDFEQYAAKKQINSMFMGRLPYDEMVGILGVCDIEIKQISKGKARSIINKHGDYAAAGLPVINTQESAEYRDLVAKYHMGFNCLNNDSNNLAKKLLILIQDDDIRDQMAKNSRELAEDKFDRSKTYEQIVELIEQIKPL